MNIIIGLQKNEPNKLSSITLEQLEKMAFANGSENGGENGGGGCQAVYKLKYVDCTATIKYYDANCDCIVYKSVPGKQMACIFGGSSCCGGPHDCYPSGEPYN